MRHPACLIRKDVFPKKKPLISMSAGSIEERHGTPTQRGALGAWCSWACGLVAIGSGLALDTALSGSINRAPLACPERDWDAAIACAGAKSVDQSATTSTC